MPAPRLRPLLVALALTLPLDLGCKRDAQETVVPDDQDHALDQATRDLLLALRQNDDARLAELATTDFVASLDAPARVQLREALDWLGYVDELAQVSEEAIDGGIARRYAVKFENGEVELTVSTIGDRIDGLQFEETMWAQIVERAHKAAIGDLRVAEFQFTSPEGEPLAAPTNPKAIHYSIALEGLHSELREHQVSVVKAVFNAKGAQVYKEREPEELRFPEAEVGSSGGRLTGSVAVPKKGSYELELQITDKLAGDTIVHRQPFTIE
jgi:hypothetical protein